MEKLLDVLNDLTQIIGQVRNEISMSIRDSQEKEEELKKREDDLTVSNANLEIREGQVSKVEDVLALEKSTKETLIDVEQKAVELSNAQVKFSEQITQTKANIQVELDNLKRERELIDQEHIILDKREQDIHDKEQEFVTQLLKKIREVK